jgi:hypothetical protein
MSDYTILFIIYTPYEGYLPKRMAELESKAKLDNVSQIVVTPRNYEEKLAGLKANTVHLIELTPDNETPATEALEWLIQMPHLLKIVEGIKDYNI